MNISEKIFSLRKKLHDHNYRYYVLDDPLISDYDFDMMLKELEKLERLVAVLKSRTKRKAEEDLEDLPERVARPDARYQEDVVKLGRVPAQAGRQRSGQDQ